MSRVAEHPVPHAEAFSRDKRLSMMREIVRLMAQRGVLHRIDAPAYASTYGVLLGEVEAEMMKHMSEGGEGK